MTRPRSLMHHALFACATVALVAAPACHKEYIPHTQIEDTGDNRMILSIVEQYRGALQAKDVPSLVRLASKNYYETAGTPADPKDDFNYDGLEDFLKRRMEKYKVIMIDIMPSSIVIDEEFPDKAFVDYKFVSRYQIALGQDRDQWFTDDDVSRMHFARENGQWRIVKGM